MNNSGRILLTLKSIPGILLSVKPAGFTAGSTLSMSFLVPCMRKSDFSLLPRNGLREERAPARRQHRNDDSTDALMSDLAPASLLLLRPFSGAGMRPPAPGLARVYHVY